MSGGSGAFKGALVGGLLAPLVARVLPGALARVARAAVVGFVVLAGFLRVQAPWLGARGAVLTAAGVVLVTAVGLPWSVRSWQRRRLQARVNRARAGLQAQGAPLPEIMGGPDLEFLYRWREPAWALPRVCFCGKRCWPGQLVYVGISNDLGRRTEQHSDDKHWCYAGLVVEVETFASRADVMAAERLAFDTEHPRENKVRPALATAGGCTGALR